MLRRYISFSCLGFLSLGLSLCVSTAYADLVAHVDRTQIAFGDVVNLELSFTGGRSRSTPDFSALEKDFDILSNQTSSNIFIENGITSLSQKWVMTLQPKRSGTIKIPPILLDKYRSNPVELLVLEPGQSGPATAKPPKSGPANAKPPISGPAATKPPNSVSAQPDYFLEAEASPLDPYVQAQVIYTVRLYIGVAMSAMRLTDPALENALVEELDSNQFEQNKNGRNYDVVEKRYAIFPQKSGELVIPAQRFQGVIQSHRRIDPFGFNNPFGPDPSQLGTGRTIAAASRVITLNVKPQTPHKGEWLPAQALLFEDDKPNEPIKLGEPFTRTLTLQAQGLTGAQLPDINMAESAEYTMYADQPEIQNYKNGDSVVGKKQRKIAIVPKKAGTLVLPPLQLSWFDTKQKKIREAVIPLRRLEVIAAPGTPGKTPDANAVAPGKSLANEQQGSFDYNGAGWWPWVSLMTLCGWIVTAVLWLSDRRRQLSSKKNAAQDSNAKRDPPGLKAARKALIAACKINRPEAARDALINWASAVWRVDPPRTLINLSSRVDDNTIRKCLIELDQALYKPDQKWSGQTFAMAFEKYSLRSSPEKSATGGVLPALNPT